ncbi:hypothetical protein AALP_AA4G007600 [Arabis alpina]|uniref:HMA domain-containing protein n=1 Tax=Arabis alpina TaxID=50452 RepID=A0A087H0B6_ARAAL|nr:hypothetical protein AALP_AA4G007600 [Arabis alpina]
MMTQRIVLKVDMGESEKSRKKAMKVASGTSGVRSVSIQGQNDQLVVLGEEIDTAELTRELRKKVGPTNIMAVQAAPPPRPQQQQSHAYQMGYQNIDMAPARRCNSMKIVSASTGVTSVAIQGQNDQLVVLGEGIDTAELTRELRKKVGHTTIVSVSAAPPPPPKPQQQQPSYGYPLGEQYNEMALVRRCSCETYNSGYCGFCRSMGHNNYQMVAPSYTTPGMYGGYRENPDGCRIM